MMGNVLVNCALLDVGIQWAMWAVSALLQTERLYDLTGSGTFVLLAHLSRRWGGTGYRRPQIQTGLVTVWGSRLGLFLRIIKEGQDRRFNGVRNSPETFFIYWTVQAAWIFITLLPTLILNTENDDEPLGLRDYLGWSLWAVGFATEAIADQQKWIFKSDPDNSGKFIKTGLWGYSRHPNYLGEILMWTGLFVSASSVLQGMQYVSIVSPLFIWFLLNYVSGIPLLERQAMKKWGSDPSFQEYIKNTPVLWPFKLF
ncbi:uncharacterized protein SI:CH211-210C8.6 [Latimeria chalumnae]|uniref:Si:ch211-210c8.6 n=1 Tax=Latimeria chalumnae TaxID=7897 RepID=H3BEY6_LATCH|nr:PREDICTED: uncharacterized protein LOC102351105 [Latimeria chalumnae]|eukprot:XP_005986214.1 PREDICTED: uncharacterized protein LOC102351105 [Latimeria chalumnae]